MSVKHFSGLFFCMVVLGILGFFGLVGCSNFDSAGGGAHGITDDDRFEMGVCNIGLVLNTASENYSVYPEGEGFGTYLQIEESFDKNLELICENYSLSTNGTETVTAEQLRDALTDNISQLVEKYRARELSDCYIYKVFKWCGTSCKETATSVEVAGFNQVEWDKWISSSSATNYAVIRIQETCRENGEPCDVKFKWQ